MPIRLLNPVFYTQKTLTQTLHWPCRRHQLFAVHNLTRVPAQCMTDYRILYIYQIVLR